MTGGFLPCDSGGGCGGGGFCCGGYCGRGDGGGDDLGEVGLAVCGLVQGFFAVAHSSSSSVYCFSYFFLSSFFQFFPRQLKNLFRM